MNAPDSRRVKIAVFYDGDCPLCMREIRMLRRWDKGGCIRFINIASGDFSEEDHGKSIDELMREIHGRLPDGEWIVGVEVFRQLYSAVGFGWLVRVTRWPVISHVLDWGYRVFARNRLKLTGRCTSETCETG